MSRAADTRPKQVGLISALAHRFSRRGNVSGYNASMTSSPQQVPEDELTKPGVADSGEAPPSPPRRPWRFILLIGLVYALALAASGLIGYSTGTGQQQGARQTEIARAAEEQFELGLLDLQAERFELARKRFEYVAALDPGYPRLPELLAEALLGSSAPIATPTPQATATPNLAPVNDLFDQAMAAFAGGDWTTVVTTLLDLRVKDPGFRAVQADGLLYSALRNRGLERILASDLEGGLYDLSLAERFAPIDLEADSWRMSVDLYLTGNSYMGLNWAQAAYYLGEVCKARIWDSCYKFGRSAQAYGDQLIAANDPCAALEQYDQSLLAWENGTLVPTATKAADLCLEATRRPPPATSETPTLEATPAESVEPPTPMPTPTPEATSTGG